MNTYLATHLLGNEWIGKTPPAFTPQPWNCTWEEFYSITTKKTLENKTVIVTGDNSGIGYDLSLSLVKLNSLQNLIMVCRNHTKCADAKQQILHETKSTTNTHIHTMSMDTSSLQSVRSFCQDYVNTFISSDHPTTIDIIFMNAGIFYMKLKDHPKICPPKTHPDQIDSMFQINYLGHHLMFRLLQPYLSEPSKIIHHTSSSGAFHSYNKYGVATNNETLHTCNGTLIGMGMII